MSTFSIKTLNNWCDLTHFELINLCLFQGCSKSTLIKTALFYYSFKDLKFLNIK